MTSLEELIARQREELMRIESNGASVIVGSYKRVEETLAANLDGLLAEIEAARAAGEEVRPNWLLTRDRYQQLLAELQEETVAFLHRAIAEIQGAQAAAVDLAPGDAADLTLAALGPAPREAVAQIRSRFQVLPAAQLEKLVGFAGDGKPLGELLAELGPEQSQAAKDALAYGVASGRSPRVIAADVAKRTDIAKNRALTIARTEMIRPYREVAHNRFVASKTVESWTWLAKLDGNTCPACAAMNGTIHPVNETLHSHPNCRCAMAPNTPSWEALGFRGIPDRRPPQLTPAERFGALSEAGRLAILGRRRLAAYEAGEVTLAEMVRKTSSKRWGPGRRAATLTELGV